MPRLNLRAISYLLWLVVSIVLAGCGESSYTPRQQQLLAQFDHGIDKRGKLFFIHVCSDCHQNKYHIEVPPKGRTMEEWSMYFKKNQHTIDGEQRALSDFFSFSYRENLAKTNPMMNLLLDINQDDIHLDLGRYLLNGAKDSDTPKSCN